MQPRLSWPANSGAYYPGKSNTGQDALGNIASFTYQGYDLQSLTDPLNRTTNYVVDTLGRRIATRDALGNVTLAQYDTNNRAVSATDALNQTTTQNYDAGCGTDQRHSC
ncbi:hypothetical protein EO087_02995 [Dyella sp. M7H15-1]|uniref:hypothetical protein n=1 Tax=Dyella sp. M7H15-1 TaxID=2501295 RepID=UPI001005201B|nr:hypothetical protein [Dyella sp. M7H15-1]QAU23081.1 hypothetical protein EO087_02995 [Dyella sp. M7H15-1]